MSEEIYENMHKTFDLVAPRIFEALKVSDLKEIYNALNDIKGPTLVTGVGGSFVSASYLAKVLNKKNKIISTSIFPRDLKHMDLSGYENVISCSYSGRNIGVDVSFENDLNKYLFSTGRRDNVTNIQYKVLNEEFSFVSLAGTLIPMAIAFMYYCDDLDLLKDILSKRVKYDTDNRRQYEILYGHEDLTSARFLESTLVEGGLGEPLLHEKYNMCHGRIIHQMNYKDSSLIYFDGDTDLDKLFKDNTLPLFDRVYTIDKKYDDEVINDFYETFIAMQLCIDIASKQGKDISKKDILPESDILYTYRGKM